MAESMLTMKQEAFCQEWIDNGGNGTQACLIVCDITNKELLEIEPKDRTTEQKEICKKVYQVAASTASEYLRIPHIRARIDALLDERGFADETVKREHFKLIVQADEATKMRAIDSYYKLKGKIIDKSEMKLDVSISQESKERADKAINDFLSTENNDNTRDSTIRE